MSTVSQILTNVKQRIDSGSPFTTPRGAWHGFERIATVGEVHITIALIEKSVIALRATTRNLLVGSLAIANRLGRGQYEITGDLADIEKWLAEVLPVEAAPVVEEKPVSLLDLALAELAARSQWSNEAVTIWQNGDKQAWLSRDKNGFICLQLFKNHEKLNRRRYSERLAVGFYSPADKMFIESHSVRDDYGRWSQQARQAVA